MVRCKANQCDQLVTVFRILHGTEFENVAIDLMDLGEPLGLFFHDLRERLDDTPQNRLLDLAQERSILECFAGNIQRKVVSLNGAMSPNSSSQR